MKKEDFCKSYFQMNKDSVEIFQIILEVILVDFKKTPMTLILKERTFDTCYIFIDKDYVWSYSTLYPNDSSIPQDYKDHYRKLTQEDIFKL